MHDYCGEIVGEPLRTRQCHRAGCIGLAILTLCAGLVFCLGPHLEATGAVARSPFLRFVEQHLPRSESDNTSALVGTWLFGREQARCFIQLLDTGQLQFNVPLPEDQTASGELHQVQNWWVAQLSANDGEHVGSIRLVLLDAGSMTTNFKYPGEREWGGDTLAQKELPKLQAPTTKPPIQDEPLRWEVTTPHGLNVRGRPDATAPVMDTRWKGSVVKGWRDGAWLRLTDDGGFMLMKNKRDPSKPFLACLDGEEKCAPSTTTITTRTETLTTTSTLVTTMAPTPAPTPSTKITSTQAPTHEPTPVPTPSPTPEPTQATVVDGKMGTWVVVTPNGLNVRQTRNPWAIVLDNKVHGSKVRGKLVGEGDWLQLIDEAGFMMVSSGRKRFLERSTTG